ncbi:MAG TPA: hypothetical protein VGK60_05285, partial [Pedococcus sp.]
MDSNIAALIGGFGGAIVGGLLTAVAAWWTTREQWDRESAARSLERLEDDVAVWFAILTSYIPENV